jgi:hypothetical protein
LHKQIDKPKFQVFIVLAALAATLALEFRAEDLTVQAENGLSFNVFEIIAKLIEVGIPVACGTEVGQLIDMLNLPPEIIGLLEMAKGIICPH